MQREITVREFENTINVIENIIEPIILKRDNKEDLVIMSLEQFKNISINDKKIIPENVNKAIQEFVNGVKEILGDRLKKIILYGSYARGDYNESSDVDIMILTDMSIEEINGIREKIYNLTGDIDWNYDFNIDISPLIKNIDNYNKRINVVPFYMNVEKEGVVLYE